MYNNIRVIAFDADDTLWVNETYFRQAENKFSELLSTFETKNKIDQELFKVEIDNLNLYGYGIKGFVLSMIECALKLTNHKVLPAMIQQILDIGKDMLNKPIELLDGVEEVLQDISKKYKLIVATKGDLLDQQKKLEKSGLSKYFHHIEVMSEKKVLDYEKLLNHLDIQPSELLMIGNSLKSDVLPLLDIGAEAIHIPFHTTWAHEEVSAQDALDSEYKTLQSIKEIIPILR